MFRTSVVHLQERSCAVCCNLVCLDTSCCYEGEGRTAAAAAVVVVVVAVAMVVLVVVVVVS
jgi:hypothetical protein